MMISNEGKRMVTQHRLTVADHTIAYYTAGQPSSPPLILVHGLLSFHGVWRHTIERLQSSFYCIAIDLLGYGASDKPRHGDYTIPAQAKRVIAVADALGLDHFNLIGHSMGGQTALYIAAVLAPSRVLQLVNVSGVASGTLQRHTTKTGKPLLRAAWRYPIVRWASRWLMEVPPYARYQFRHWFYRQLPSDQWEPDRIMTTILGIENSAYASLMAIESCDLTEHLPNVTARTQVLFGLQDGVVPTSEGELVSHLVKGATITWFDDCGHFPMIEITEQYLTALVEFLDYHS
jgi:pimeloyl-ACP methyl ester carboxylesterase